MKVNGLKKAMPALLLLIVISLGGMGLYFIHVNEETLYISHESGMYSGSFDLSFFTFGKSDIFYTLNGQAPEPGEEGTYEYTGPITVECLEDTSTLSVQVCCIYDSGNRSEVYRRDYILDPAGAERFTTDYVVSIAGDEAALFSDEEGIFVRGNQFYEYMEAHPETNLLAEVVPANYYEDIEVPVHAAIFLGDGTQIIDQNCGIKVYGNVTRQHNQKSFRLYARYDYDEVNEFSYPFFEDLCTYEGKAPITEWQRLSFHNSGNDNDNGYIRSALMGDLARQSGYQDTLGAESVTVYINGKYMGVYWLQNTYDDRYFEERYGDYEGEVAVAEGTLGTMDVSLAESKTELVAAEDYNAFCEWLFDADVNNEDDWQRICNTIDVDNFAHYFALEYYTGNVDWPQNNVKVYRYIPMEGEAYREGTIFDGRYRYLLFDTDYSMGLVVFGFYGNDASTKTLWDFKHTNEHTIVFSKLSEREEFRDLFVGKVMFLMNEIFVRQNVSDQMYALNVTRHLELRYMIEETDILKDSIWEAWGVGRGDMAQTEQEWNEILAYVELRPQYVISEISYDLYAGATFNLKVLMEHSGSILINGMDAGESYEGVWMDNIPLEVSCAEMPGVVVKGYTVNGIFVEGKTLCLESEDYAQYGADITIVPVIEIVSQQSLEVVAFRINDSQDYVVLQNTGNVALNLNEYALGDDEDSMSGKTLPEVMLAPGEQYTVYGAKYTGDMDTKGTQVSFSWNDEEKVCLYHESTGIVVY
ncbi:MAG: CotH kinase family protein [Lachnospiraceae bacterium]|nr:CotH kinase family protein [Lachnospiraceae bacterium]